MKKITILLLMCGLFALTKAAIEIKTPEHVKQQEYWDDIGEIRSITPTCPQIYLCGNEINIVYEGNGAELLVTVTGQNGEIVYKGNYGSPFTVNGQVSPDYEYKILVEHPLYGYVLGSFTLE